MELSAGLPLCSNADGFAPRGARNELSAGGAQSLVQI